MSRRLVLILTAIIAAASLLTPLAASASTAIERVERERLDAAREIRDLLRQLRTEVSGQRTQVPLAELLRARGGGHHDAPALDEVLAAADRQAERRGDALSRLRDRVVGRIDRLRARREQLTAWLDGLTFRVCPVEGYTELYDDFGEMVRLPDVPVHVHQGNDVTAPTGTPIRAPFDGYAASSWGTLGGLEVRVTGDRGYVYIAHLHSVGRLGWVPAGTIIGYVGATGDATAPHAHIEWRPGGGGPVDPYPLLALACLPV